MCERAWCVEVRVPAMFWYKTIFWCPDELRHRVLIHQSRRISGLSEERKNLIFSLSVMFSSSLQPPTLWCLESTN